MKIFKILIIIVVLLLFTVIDIVNSLLFHNTNVKSNHHHHHRDGNGFSIGDDEPIYGDIHQIQSKENITLEEDRSSIPSILHQQQSQQQSSSSSLSSSIKNGKIFSSQESGSSKWTRKDQSSRNQQPTYDTPFTIFYFLIGLSITAFLFIIYYLNMKDLQLRSPTIRTPLLKIDNGHLQPKSPSSLTVSPLSLNQSRSFSS
ncbi:hypothetical protein DERF_008327 [Dermatophagoides farinae]|uniref:Transmembrane protein n=1 Tax=Dermatophagoides farinae TaxID=6954 RepID=A0A922I2Z8_DERFA|nr:hypothetical protein DERF_008327 [Dermatophagoides farinae]